MGDFSPIGIGCFAAINTTNAVSITAVDGNAAGRRGASEISVRGENFARGEIFGRGEISGLDEICRKRRISGKDKIFGEEQNPWRRVWVGAFFLC